MLKLEVSEEYEGYGRIHIYNSEETGRILIMVHADADYDELLLFSPLGILEKDSVNSTFEPHEMVMIIEKILKKNRSFRNKLIRDFCRSRERFNISLRDFFNVKFDFFLQCETIAEINPFCIDRNSFKNCVDRISNAINTIDHKEVQDFVEIEKGEIKSIQALVKVFEKAGRTDNVAHDLKDLRTIQRLRNITPTHSTNDPFVQFLKRFDKKYPNPNNPEEWCDLSIFTLQETSRVINKISIVLSQ